ncbi:PREDICTED: putative golgin subfamily A member 8F/8G isoform X1 [Cercocebus atys]|uniref:putative golgin subfamily A member 8F/8G isoform X1 n=1 Tax=Cercocebus atys TaxID=9531 RepID=UPI0005F56327|nr:PREDICTED: putative golgin subfamily A member 8F/8G isoform X1 [Cercocebus atys]
MGGPVLGHWWHSGGMSLAVPSLPPPGKSSVFLFLQEKKSNNERQSQKAARDESKDLAGCLQHSLQHIAELERALSAVTATQEKKEISVCTLEKEKKHDTRWVEKLERSLSKLKNQRESRGPYCLLPFSAEPLPLEPPAVPSEVELQHLRKEVERMAGELQAQVDDNQRMSVLIWGQKERLQEQEERFREQEERLREQEERLQEQEERLREQEERLWEQDERIQQLAEPQSGFEELNSENKSALQLEHQTCGALGSSQVWTSSSQLEELLEAASQQKQPLQAQLSLTTLPGEGDGGGHLDSEEEEAPQPMPTVPEDLESWEAMLSLTPPAPILPPSCVVPPRPLYALGFPAF